MRTIPFLFLLIIIIQPAQSQKTFPVFEKFIIDSIGQNLGVKLSK